MHINSFSICSGVITLGSVSYTHLDVYKRQELYFRDYLIEHTDIAIEYERMKLELWKKYEFDRDGYTNSKTDFIQKYTEKAKLEYGDRY